MKQTHLIARLVSLAAVGAAFIALLAVVMFRMQVVEAANTASGKETTKTVVYSYPVKAARGEILDRYGRALVTNRTAYIVRFNKAIWPSSSQNGIILSLIRLMDEAGSEYMDTLPITKTIPFTYTLDASSTESSRKTFDNFVADNELTAGTADEILNQLFDRYGLNPKLDDDGNTPEDFVEYTELEKRLIAGVRYEMEVREFSQLVPFTFASDVDMSVVTQIKENSLLYKGVEVDTEPVRQYNTTLAAHILGRVGKIYKEEYEELRDQGYRMDATVGKDGAEKAFEEYLRGTDGVRTLEIDESGRTVNQIADSTAVPGNNISLTIDLELQSAAEKALASRIEEIKALSAEDPDKYPADVGGGVAVVLDVNSFAVLASASYPTYNLETFAQDYNELVKDELFPMVNRAIGSTYSPGSIYKMCTAVAGLEEGVITPRTIITDLGIYTKYKSYQPQCWIYRQNGGQTHGDETVSDAIRDSCNYFFYQMSDELGIDKLDSYAAQFGLGEKTGIELAGEVKGTRSNPETKAKVDTLLWSPGDTMQTAIGQLYNLFTPMQLCAYLAAVCNGGYYYQTHILQNVRSYDYSSIIKENTATLLRRIDMSDETYNAVMLGMKDAAENGTAAAVFKDYPIQVGGKTGSAQVSKGTSNGVFAAFAPYDNPEIAVVVIVEHGGSGGNVGIIARNIMDAYFGIDRSSGTATTENGLIG